MNSKERHEARYQRRKAKRAIKANNEHIKYADVFSFANMYNRGKECCHDVRWKTSTNNFEIYMVERISVLSSQLENKTYKYQGFSHFITIEHGKQRKIAALKIDDRTVQKCINQDCMLPIYARSFVIENSASLKDRGMDWTIKRLRQNLAWHYRRYGIEGGIYQFDFKNYFGSLPHDKLKEKIQSKVQDCDLQNLLCQLVDDFRDLKTVIIDEDNKSYGVGLGSEVSQTFSLDYVSPIDHYVKDVKQKHGYGRYMDDGYIISNSLKELYNIKKELYKLAEDLGVAMSDKKNIITPFKSHSFVFLKFRVRLQSNGKIIMKLSRNSIKSIRRKIKFFRKQLDLGKMDIEDVCSSYQAWRAHAKRCNSYNTLKNMDIYFVKTFKQELARKKKSFKCFLKPVKNGKYWQYIFL